MLEFYLLVTGSIKDKDIKGKRDGVKNYEESVKTAL